MIEFISILIVIIIYQISRGIIEGLVFEIAEYTKHQEGRYHIFRLIESILVITLLILSLNNLLLGVSVWFLSVPVYETSVISYRAKRFRIKPFPGNYAIFKFDISYSSRDKLLFNISMFIIGIVFIGAYFVS